MKPIICRKHNAAFLTARGGRVRRCPECVAQAKQKVAAEKDRYWRGHSKTAARSVPVFHGLER